MSRLIFPNNYQLRRIADTIMRRVEIIRRYTGIQDLPEGISVEGVIPSCGEYQIESFTANGDTTIFKLSFVGVTNEVVIRIDNLLLKRLNPQYGDYLLAINELFDFLLMKKLADCLEDKNNLSTLK